MFFPNKRYGYFIANLAIVVVLSMSLILFGFILINPGLTIFSPKKIKKEKE